MYLKVGTRLNDYKRDCFLHFVRKLNARGTAFGFKNTTYSNYYGMNAPKITDCRENMPTSELGYGRWLVLIYCKTDKGEDSD